MPDSFKTQGETQGIDVSGERSRSLFAQRPRARWFLLVVVATPLAVAGYFAQQYYAVRETTDDAQINGSIIPVSPRVPGIVQEVFIEENQQVKAGTVLFQIDPDEYRVAVERAKAELAQAEASAQGARTSVPITTTTTGSTLSTAQAQVSVATAGVNTARKEIDVASARVASAQAQLQQAEASQRNAAQTLQRYRQLIAKDEISEQQYDAAVTADNASSAAVAAAKAVLTAAEQDVAVAESRLEESKARLLQAQAEVRAAETAPARVAVTETEARAANARVRLQQAELDQALLNLGYTTVKAPVDGVVSKKSVEVGMNVAKGQPMLAVVPLDNLWITANFKETQITNMHPGQKAVIRVDTYDGHDYDGHIESIAAATGEKFSLLPAENATGNFVKVVQRIPVRIRLSQDQDSEHILRPGMSVVVSVLTQ